MKLSAIILAKTTTHESYKITMNCIDSLMNSESNLNLEIIIIESNKDFYSSNFKYPNLVKIVIPIDTFNFHKFLNIGIKEASGDYLGLFNNDLIFHKNWFSEIIKAANQNNKILSFSPFGTILTENEKDKYDTGYKVGTHINGWCLVVKKQLFSIIDKLDERFDFFYADNDYAMTLKKYNVKHAIVYNSYVEHLEKKREQVDDSNFGQEKPFWKKYKIPNYIFEDNNKWILEHEICLRGYISYHNKWGKPSLLYKRNRIADELIKYKLGYFVRFIL